MIDAEAVRIAQERVQLEISEQTASLRQEVVRLKERMNARGALHSGGYVVNVTRLCVDAIKNRAQLVWQTLFRCITTSGISYSDTLSHALKEFVARHLPENLPELKEIVKAEAKLIGMSNLFEHVEPQLDSARTAALAKVGTEIDLFVHSLKKKVE